MGILTEADRCCKPGAIGALLRQEGLYSSHLTEWRRQRASGFHVTQNQQNCICLQLNPYLTLVIKRSIERTDIQINLLKDNRSLCIYICHTLGP